MRLKEFHLLRDEAGFAERAEWAAVDGEIREAIAAVSWPPGQAGFVIRPDRRGNGVTPIKAGFIEVLDAHGWRTEERVRLLDKGGPGKIDALRDFPDGGRFVCEWETGNVSSSHRALNKLTVALKEDNIRGGALIVPDRALAAYLTDRIGNFEELEPYFQLWREAPLHGGGLLGVYVVTFDATDPDVPVIAKGTDGRALV